jgi:hypothetical protein
MAGAIPADKAFIHIVLQKFSRKDAKSQRHSKKKNVHRQIRRSPFFGAGRNFVIS